MKEVKVKELSVKAPKKKDAIKLSDPKKDEMKALFMEQCNERRAIAGLPMAYSEEEIAKYK